MFDQLMRQLKKPEAYRENHEAFWNDEYISKQLLAAHLNPDFEGASRKLRNRSNGLVLKLVEML